MRRMMLALAAVGLLAAGSPARVAEAARAQEADCRDYCAEKAAQKCEDVSSTWCNVYIMGCLAGCGYTHL